ncbi:MAG: flavodoxin family protein [Desulfobacteraceae bacterium]|nr:flavodoxin family protein [Desulfobacteraceae bacterium]
MYVLGIIGSPRPKGNSHYLLSVFMEEMKIKGYSTKILDAAKLKINNCIGCGNCETKGECVFKDDFTSIVLPEIIKADSIVISSPVYFYAFPAALKSLIDRIQVLWSRKYRLKTNDFKTRERKGILFAVGASKGKDLFQGLKLTTKYFFDAADIKFETKLCYTGIDEKGKIQEHPTVNKDIKELASLF